MAREKGLASFSANFESQMASPIDARMIVATKADLLLEATWQANDGGVYVYKGMIVCVHSDVTSANNGIYRLTDLDYTQAGNWSKVEAEGGSVEWGEITGDQTVVGLEGFSVGDDVDFNLNELLNIRVENIGSLPSAGNAGRVVFLTSDKHLYLDTGA